MKKITLNRNQITKLWEIVNHFKEIDKFKISTSSNSGIGTDVIVEFSLFDNDDTKVDITDITEW